MAKRKTTKETSSSNASPKREQLFEDLSFEEMLHAFHAKLKHHESVAPLLLGDKLREVLTLRLQMQLEETAELAAALGCSEGVAMKFEAISKAISLDKFPYPMDPIEIIDAFADTAVFSVGSIDLLLQDSNAVKAVLGKVMAANFEKEPGVKPGRPNPLGLPDAIKPEGWTAPDLSEFVPDYFCPERKKVTQKELPLGNSNE